MPSATPPQPSSRGQGRTLSEPAQTGERNPRVRAALCYAFPVVPASIALWNERRNRFVRFHAAQALVFFVTLVLAQVLLFAVVVFLGNFVGVSSSSLFFGIAVVVGYLAFAAWALTMWLRFLSECMTGRATLMRYFGDWALLVESTVMRLQGQDSAGRDMRKNSPVS